MVGTVPTRQKPLTNAAAISMKFWPSCRWNCSRGKMGVLDAEIDAGMKKSGLVIATADLLIGVTALHYGYALGTRNVRHFRIIPGLQVLPL